jgi:hypothetical protein
MLLRGRGCSSFVLRHLVHEISTATKTTGIVNRRSRILCTLSSTFCSVLSSRIGRLFSASPSKG